MKQQYGEAFATGEKSHEIRDKVIEEFDRRLNETIGEQDVAAHLNSDEFVLLLFDIKTEVQAKNIAEKIQRTMRNTW